MNDTTREYLENRRKEYLEERKALVELEWRGGDSFVKTMTTLSAGALGLSLAFVERLAPKPLPYTLGYVRGAWIAFALALALLLAAHLASQLSMRRQRALLDQAWIEEARAAGVPPGKAAPRRPVPPNNRWAPATFALNLLALLAFVAGTALLAAFTWLNLPGG